MFSLSRQRIRSIEKVNKTRGTGTETRTNVADDSKKECERTTERRHCVLSLRERVRQSAQGTKELREPPAQTGTAPFSAMLETQIFYA